MCVAVQALAFLDMSKINVGIPSMERSLGAGATEVQLIVAGYALAFGLTLVPAGRLGDLHSRKVMFVIGLSLFTVVSFMCAAAPTAEVLVIARMLQGVAAGMLTPQVLGLIQVLFTGPERGTAFGIFGSITGICTAFGPALGGVLLELGGPVDGWRWLFWVNLPFCVGALVFAIKMLPASQPSLLNERSLDLVGLGLLGGAVFSLMLPFVLTSGGPDDDPRRWFWLVGVAVFFPAFIWWERRYRRIGKAPVVDFALLRLSSYRNGILLGTAHFGATPALFLLMAILVQQGLGFSPIVAGLVSLPFMVASSAVAWWAGRLVGRFGPWVVVWGVIATILGYSGIVLTAVGVDRDIVPWAVAPSMFLMGFGSGLVVAPNQTLTLSQVPVTSGGVAGSLGQVGQRMGSAIGIAIGASTFYSVLNSLGGVESGPDEYRLAYLAGTGAAALLFVLSLTISFVDVRDARHR